MTATAIKVFPLFVASRFSRVAALTDLSGNLPFLRGPACPRMSPHILARPCVAPGRIFILVDFRQMSGTFSA